MDTEILLLLEKNPLQNLPVIGFFEHYKPERILRHDDFMLLTGTSDKCWAFLSGSSPSGMHVVLSEFAFDSLYFANVEEWMLPILTRQRPVEWKLTTIRYYLAFDIEVLPPEEVCSPLEESQSSYVYDNSSYKDYTEESYITDRLQKDISAGIWLDETLVGWGLTHDDGSLGFLNVLEEHRGNGYGEALLRSMILQKRKLKQPVFVNIEPHNIKSVNLVEKLGFTRDRLVSWVKLV